MHHEGAPGCGVPSVDPRASTEGDIVEPKPEKGARPLRGVLHRDKSTSWARDAADRCLASRRLLGIVAAAANSMPSSDFLDDQTQIPPRLTSPNCATCCTPTENSRRYRLLTWRKLLRLPNNEDVRGAVVGDSRARIFPAVSISDRTLLLRLQHVCSSLSLVSYLADLPSCLVWCFPSSRLGANRCTPSRRLPLW